MVGDALDEIPDALANELENVAVMVEDWPTPEQLARVGAHGTLLGLYEGVPLTKRGPLSYNGVSPDRITIFQGPLSRRAADLDALAAQVRVTVLHEVGQLLRDGRRSPPRTGLGVGVASVPWRTPTT